MGRLCYLKFTLPHARDDMTTSLPVVDGGYVVSRSYASKKGLPACLSDTLKSELYVSVVERGGLSLSDRN